MQSLGINRVLIGSIAVIVIAANSMTLVPLLDQPAVADEPAAAPTIVPQQPSLDNAFQDFADPKALDQRLRTLEQQIQTLSNTAPTIALQQPPVSTPPQDFADHKALDQEQFQTLSNTGERPVQTLTETFPKSSVRLKETTTKYRYRRRHETEGSTLAKETGYANRGARP